MNYVNIFMYQGNKSENLLTENELVHGGYEVLANKSRRKKKRILLLANTAWFLHNFCSGLVASLEEQGYELIMASPKDQDAQYDIFKDRSHVSIPMTRKGLNPVKEIFTLFRLAWLFKKMRPDIVLTWTPKPNIYAGLVGRIMRIPIIPNISGLGSVFIEKGWLSWLVSRMYGTAVSACPVIYLLNDRDRRFFIDSAWVSPERAVLLPGTGVDLNKFHYFPLPPRNDFVFLYIGRLLKDKGLYELVDAACKLREKGAQFELQLAGFIDPGNPAGIDKDELDSWVRKGWVKYLGALSDVRPALRDAHCVLLPSSYREGLPRSLLEAAATGRPIITTDMPGCRDTVIAEQSGFLCKPKDVASLESCMQRMLRLAPDTLESMGMAGREFVKENFSEKIVIDAYMQVCRRV